MPIKLSRGAALRRIRAEHDGRRGCLMCAIIARRVGPVHALYEDERAIVFLPRYVTRWGALCVVPKAHVTRLDDVARELWAHSNALAHASARVIERVLLPRRCYVASIGSAAGELAQSSEHLHLHAVPVMRATDRPSGVFSWEHGVLTGTEAEWSALSARYVEAWKTVWPDGG